MSRTAIVLLTLSASVPFAGSASAADLAVNGGFETGDFTGWVQFPSPNAGAQAIVTPGSASTYAADLNNITPGAADVLKNANLGVGTVTANEPITISFDAIGNFGPGGVAFCELFSELSGGGTSKSEILSGAPLNGGASFGNYTNNDWKHFTFNTTTGADVGGGVTVQFNAATGAFSGSTAELLVDNLQVSVASAPEPASMAVMGVGATALLARRRRMA